MALRCRPATRGDLFFQAIAPTPFRHRPSPLPPRASIRLLPHFRSRSHCHVEIRRRCARPCTRRTSPRTCTADTVTAAELKLDADLGQTVLSTSKPGSVYLRLSLKSLAAAKTRAAHADQRRHRHRPLRLDAGRPHRRRQGRRARRAEAPVVRRHRLARRLQPRRRRAEPGGAAARLARQADRSHRQPAGDGHHRALRRRQGRRPTGRGVRLRQQRQPRHPAVGRPRQRRPVDARRARRARPQARLQGHLGLAPSASGSTTTRT